MKFFIFIFSKNINFIVEKELYVDKSVLCSVSKVFQLYFQDKDIHLLEIIDVTLNDMIELLQFLYPQFQCTIHQQNITILLILGRLLLNVIFCFLLLQDNS